MLTTQTEMLLKTFQTAALAFNVPFDCTSPSAPGSLLVRFDALAAPKRLTELDLKANHLCPHGLSQSIDPNQVGARFSVDREHYRD